MTARDDVPSIHPADRAAWRPRTRRPRLEYEDAICEALCFGWVDSSGGVIDEERAKLYFAPRRPGSVWAGSNRGRVAQLIADGQMTPAGLATVERAKADGSWTVLEAAEQPNVPPDLVARPSAAVNFAAFPPSARKMALSWIATAKRAERRERRIAAVADEAMRNERVPA